MNTKLMIWEENRLPQSINNLSLLCFLLINEIKLIDFPLGVHHYSCTALQDAANTLQIRTVKIQERLLFLPFVSLMSLMLWDVKGQRYDAFFMSLPHGKQMIKYTFFYLSPST